MAEVITRLKVESTEYDSKIKRASQGLLHMESACRKVGGTLAILDKEDRAFVQSLGKMETVSKSARGSLQELTAAYTDLSVQYKRLTEEEKRGEYGKILSEQLGVLKGRITDARQQLDEVGKELGETGRTAKDTGGILGALSEKFTVNIDALKLLEIGLGAAKGALSVATDAFFASEANVDEWGRTVESSRSLYEGFLTAINTGDISGYLGRIDDIVKAARDAYNALDRLGTMQTIQAPQLAGKQSEIQRMQAMLRSGRYISPADGRSSGGLRDGQTLTPEQKKAIAANLQSAMGDVGNIYRQQVGASTDAINALYREQALRLGMSNEAFRKGTASMEAFEHNLAMAAKYREWEAAHTATVGGSQASMSVRAGGANPYASYKGWGVFKDDGSMYQQIVSQIQNRASLTSQYYSQVGSSYRAINRAGGGAGGGRAGGGAGGAGVSSGLKMQDFAVATIGTTKSMAELQAQLGMYKQALQNATNAIDAGAAQAGITSTQAQIAAQPLALRAGIDAESMAQVQEGIDAFIEQIRANMEPLEIKVGTGGSAATGKQTAQAWQAAANAVSNVGAALQQIEDPSAKIAGIVGQAVANIALGFAQAAASPATGAAGVFGWIAAATAGLATMVATIATIKNQTAGSFAEGGIVPGTSYNGDRLTANVNSGELILNRAQQDRLATDLAGMSTAQVMNSRATISGEQIILAVNAYGRRTGRGELIRV